jgi:hypothetical protein
MTVPVSQGLQRARRLTACKRGRLGVNKFPAIFSVTSDQEIGVDCGPGALEPFSYVPIIWADMVPLYQKEAEMGNRIAVNNLGVCLQFGRGIAKDEVAAVACYNKAMKQGSILAQNNLSMCYLRGVGVDMDEEKAIALYALSFCVVFVSCPLCSRPA